MYMYAPVACCELVRILLALQLQFRWSRHHVDVKGTFLCYKLPDDSQLFIRLPKISGVDQTDGRVVRLRKYPYGLREAPRLWYKTFASSFYSIGFRRLISNDCLFMLQHEKKRLIVLVYVDDIAMFGNADLIDFFKSKLRKSFTITDLGTSELFLA